MIPRHVCSFFLVAAVHVSGGYARGQSVSTNPPAAPSSPAPPSDDEKATELFLQGKAFFAEGKLKEAYKAYKTAWSFKMRYDIAGNLGNVAFELGKMRDAAEYLSYCKMNFPDTASPEQRAKLEYLLGEAREHVGTVSMSLRGKGRIFLDGDPLPTGEGPVDRLEVFVEPGKRTLVVKRPGFKPTQKTIEVTAGSTQDLEVEVPTTSLAPVAVKPVAPAPGTPDVVVDPKLQKRRRTILIGGMAAAGAGVFVGTVTAIVSSGKQAAVDEKQTELMRAGGPQACASQTFRSQCDELGSLDQSHATLANVSIWSFISASLLAGGTAAYYMLSAPPPAPKTGHASPSLDLAVMPSGGGFTVRGTW